MVAQTRRPWCGACPVAKRGRREPRNTTCGCVRISPRGEIPRSTYHEEDAPALAGDTTVRHHLTSPLASDGACEETTARRARERRPVPPKSGRGLGASTPRAAPRGPAAAATASARRGWPAGRAGSTKVVNGSTWMPMSSPQKRGMPHALPISSLEIGAQRHTPADDARCHGGGRPSPGLLCPRCSLVGAPGRSDGCAATKHPNGPRERGFSSSF